MSQSPFIIYGSGDKGTAELCDIFFQRKLSIEYRDIRATNENGIRVNLQKLDRFAACHRSSYDQPESSDTVPQTFLADGTYIGNFEQTLAYLDREHADKLVA